MYVSKQLIAVFITVENKGNESSFKRPYFIKFHRAIRIKPCASLLVGWEVKWSRWSGEDVRSYVVNVEAIKFVAFCMLWFTHREVLNSLPEDGNGVILSCTMNVVDDICLCNRYPMNFACSAANP